VQGCPAGPAAVLGTGPRGVPPAPHCCDHHQTSKAQADAIMHADGRKRAAAPAWSMPASCERSAWAHLLLWRAPPPPPPPHLIIAHTPTLPQVLGRGLAQLPRDQIVVATKVGRYGSDTFDFRCGVAPLVRVRKVYVMWSGSLGGYVGGHLGGRLVGGWMWWGGCLWVCVCGWGGGAAPKMEPGSVLQPVTLWPAAGPSLCRPCRCKACSRLSASSAGGGPPRLAPAAHPATASRPRPGPLWLPRAAVRSAWRRACKSLCGGCSSITWT
jgi:hypothetical protein